MLRVFNCGIGMAMVVSDADLAISLLEQSGETCFPLGRIDAHTGAPRVRMDPLTHFHG
jgi:phosphoribosylformylglycinamidine cyclo-ligase